MLLSLMAAHEQEKQRANQQQNRAENLQKKSDELYIENRSSCRSRWIDSNAGTTDPARIA